MNQANLNTFFGEASKLPRTTLLLRENGLRILLIHLNANESWEEHKAPGAISLQALTGEVFFSDGERQVNLTPGILVSLQSEQLHSLRANQESLLLLTVSDQSQG